MQVCACVKDVQHRGSAAYQARDRAIRPAALHYPGIGTVSRTVRFRCEVEVEEVPVPYAV